jgi:hypothetical protein
MTNINNEIQSLGELTRRFGRTVMDEALTKRLGLVVIDGRKVANDNAIKYLETVADALGVEVAEWLTGAIGSAWYDDVIYVGADVADDAREFVVYHEFKHWLDYVGRGVVPSDEHSSIRSSRIEKECDLYALRRVVEESGLGAGEKALGWMINYHFQWDVDHPDDPSDLLYRAVLLYRLVRRKGWLIGVRGRDMKDLQKSQRWWR